MMATNSDRVVKPTEFDLEQFQSCYPDGINNHYWNDARNKLILKHIRESGMKQLPILEIGCGRGGVVAFLKSNNIDIFGIELAPCTPFAEAEGDVLTGTDAFETSEAFKAKYKVLLLLDVIEHIEDPVSFVRKICEAYTNLEYILFTVPAGNDIWSNYDEYYGHFRRYDLEMTKSFVRESGFVLKENRYVFHLLYWAARLLTRLKRDRNLKLSPPSGINKIVHRVLSKYFIAEHNLLPQTWRGSSVFCIASIPRK